MTIFGSARVAIRGAVRSRIRKECAYNIVGFSKYIVLSFCQVVMV